MPVLLSAGLSSETATLEAMTAPVSRLTKVTVALRISPASGSSPGNAAVMSWKVARSVTVAVELLSDGVETYATPL